MSVNYFAFVGTVGSIIALLVIPGIGFKMPDGPREWILLFLLGSFGFGLQFLLTAGLQLDRTSKATSMLYTQVLFALSFDWVIWGVLPDGLSFLGSAVVIASTLWSALQKTHPAKVEGKNAKVVDEESALLSAKLDEDEVESMVRRGSVSA
jgi:drug/metabolite transporter (DMT)-like permease